MAKNQNERGLKSTRETNSSTTPSSGQNYVLAIAIDEYKAFPPLFNCVKDAKDLIGLLTSKFQFEKDNVFTLFNEEATEEKIFTNFRILIQKIKPVDSLIIYFAGHGEFIQDFNEGYWVPVDAKDKAIGQYIPNSQIKTMLTAIKSQHTFLIADSCFSGSLFLRGNHRNIVRRRVERFASRWGLTSGRSEIVGDGNPGENSPFATSILNLLKGSSKGLSVQELCAHVTETVAANASQTPIGEPLNIKGHEGGQFVFHLKKNEERDWFVAKEKNTADAYEHFITMYPEGKYFSKANNLFFELKEEEDWELAKQANTINGFLIYKKQYPEGKYVNNAINKIDDLEDEKEWIIISQRNRLSEYLRYIHNYPLGKYVDEAQKKIDLLDPQRKLDRTIAPIKDKPEVVSPSNKVENKEKEVELVESLGIAAVKEIPDKNSEKDHLKIITLLKYTVPALFVLALFVAWNLLQSSDIGGDSTGDSTVLIENGENDNNVSPIVDGTNDKPEVIVNLDVSKDKSDNPSITNQPVIAAPNSNPPNVLTKKNDDNVQKCSDLIQSANDDYEMQQYTSALENYNKALGLCNTIVWRNLDACKFKLQEKKKAEEAAKRFSKDNSNNKPKPKPKPEPTPVSVLTKEEKIISDFENNNKLYIGGTTFQMGSDSGNSDERPVHSVTLSNFSISKYEVTRELWEAVMGTTPSEGQCNSQDCPVDNVSYEEVKEFLKKLNSKTKKGRKYRLPSEAEWEYAAKTKKGSFQKKSNIGEWCEDWYDVAFYKNSEGSTNPINKTKTSGSNRKVTRGSGFNKSKFRIADRGSFNYSKRSKYIGFRLAW